MAILTSYLTYECISSPSDTLQYLSQLESVARKLKDQLIRQNQVILSIKMIWIMKCSFAMLWISHDMVWISECDNTKKVIESELSMFVSHFSSESTAKDCKLHKIVASQGAINIDNLVKFAHLLCARTTLGWFKCFGGSGAGRGVYRGREFFFSSANVALSARTGCCYISLWLKHFLQFCHLSK